MKWAGGKRQLLHELLRRCPPPGGRYFEPFLGGGALFFALAPERATLADVNERLIRTYRGVRDDVEGVIRHLKEYRYEEAFYYDMRQKDADACPDTELAAWFIYLNKTGFNGLYRVNRENRFNVPFGRYEKPNICDEATLRACSRALASVDLLVDDFTAVAQRAERGDFVYFDPPYMPLSATSSFTSYTAGGFDEERQSCLCDVARALKKRGVRVLLSNSTSPFIEKLYAKKGFEVSRVSATRSVNSKVSKRGAIEELVIT